MFKTAQVQITNWLRTYDCEIGDFDLKIGDKVVIKTDNGSDVGRIIGLTEVPEQECEEACVVLHKITEEDVIKLEELKEQEQQAIDFCRELVDKYKLQMKIIGAHFSFDDSKLTFPFIADGRVDFRDLVRDLTGHFKKSIRLQQIGIRDEAKISGDHGPCGRCLCCKSYLDLKKCASVTSDMADSQQIAHRGSDRLTGMCGRLRCCLAFEKDTYEELAKKLPAIGHRVKTSQGQGRVVGINILKQTVNILIGGDKKGEKSVVEVHISNIKEKVNS